MLTYSLWKYKYYSKNDYKKWKYIRDKGYSYGFRLFICILFTVFCVPLDILLFIPEIIFYLIVTLNDM